jgi:tRNA dimethylallyltransferase
MTLRPLIAICGTTGVGKSNMAVELALRIQQGGLKSGWRGAKIINADSMQVYEGLNVITNKIPQEERMGVEHLLMDFKKPGEQYVVGQWVHDAIALASNVSKAGEVMLIFCFKINKIHQDGEVPIVVGGTSYWIQHLIFPDRLMSSPSTASWQSQGKKEVEGQVNDPELLRLFHSLPVSPPSAGADPEAAFKMHSLLAVLDPVMAARWHWRDTRKVLRSLEIIKDTGRKASDIVAEQSSRTAFNEPRFVRL